MSEQRTLHVFTDGVDSVVAYDADDAAAVWNEHIGDDYEGDGFEPFPDDKSLTIDRSDEDLGHETKTCREWADTEGRGFLCSTEY